MPILLALVLCRRESSKILATIARTLVPASEGAGGGRVESEGFVRRPGRSCLCLLRNFLLQGRTFCLQQNKKMEEIEAARLDGALKRAYSEWGDGPLTKQLLLRRALTLLGAGFVASNTTGARRALGAAVKRCWPDERGPAFVTATSPCRCPAVCAVRDDGDNSNEEEEEVRRITDEERDAAKRSLEERGVAVLPRVLGSRAVADVARSVNAAALSNETKLRPSIGNGSHGSYASFRPPADSPVWVLRHTLSERFQLRGDDSRVIVLRYGENGENYLHRDQLEFPVQATLLLSTPGRDFSGGDFLVRRQADGSSEEEQVAVCDNAGDVVVFDSSLSHGIRTVHAAAGASSSESSSSFSETQRFAIGLFQGLSSS